MCVYIIIYIIFIYTERVRERKKREIEKEREREKERAREREREGEREGEGEREREIERERERERERKKERNSRRVLICFYYDNNAVIIVMGNRWHRTRNSFQTYFQYTNHGKPDKADFSFLACRWLLFYKLCLSFFFFKLNNFIALMFFIHISGKYFIVECDTSGCLFSVTLSGSCQMNLNVDVFAMLCILFCVKYIALILCSCYSL